METNTHTQTASVVPETTQRAYWRQNTGEGHPHSYTLVNGSHVQDFPTYGELCAFCRKNNIIAHLA